MEAFPYAGLLYSQEETIKLSDLKNKTYPLNVDVTRIRDWCARQGIFCCMQGSSLFHYKFKLLKPMPYILYGQGDLSRLDKPILGIVGPRKMTAYAERIMVELFSSLQNLDLVTVSGLADGVDSLCHKLSIEKKIPTIAILGGGLGRFLQGKKRNLITDIVANGGLVLSEFKLKQESTHYTFPQRNRIIAGLSDLLFVPEAGEKSGSLLTIHDALRAKKPVYTVPGSFFAETSKGTNALLCAKKITGTLDFAAMLTSFASVRSDCPDYPKHENVPTLSSDEEVLLAVLRSCEAVSIEMLQEKTAFSSQMILSLLSLLEIQGYIVQQKPGRWSVR